MLPPETYDKILDLQRPELVEVGDRKFSTHQLREITEPTSKPLAFHSLTGVVDYIEKRIDPLAEKFAVHVVDQSRVDVISGNNDSCERHEYASARCPDGFVFDKWIAHEMFMIALQSMFVKTKVRDDLLQIVGTISGEEVQTLKDDGVTQQATAKAGLALKTTVELPNPVMLTPYRTFREVDQPETQFILRVKKDKFEGLIVALFEADGGIWKLEAMENIAHWLRGKMPTVNILA